MAQTARSKVRDAHVAHATTIRANIMTATPVRMQAPRIMQEPVANDAHDEHDNPLADLIDDTTYEMLERHGLIYEKGMRDYQIRKRYREMRKLMTSGDAIEKLRESYPYLQFDTIRKIIYKAA